MKPFVALLATLAVLPQTAKPVTLSTSIEKFDQQGLIIEGVTATLTQSTTLSTSLSATALSVIETASDLRLSDVHYQCVEQVLSERLLACSQAQFSASTPLWPERLQGRLDWQLDRSTDVTTLALNLPMLDGQVRIDARLADDQLESRITLDALSVEALVRQLMPDLLGESDQLEGLLSATVEVILPPTGSDADPQLIGDVAIEGLSADVQQGGYATAAMRMTSELAWSLGTETSVLELKTRLHSGELLAGPVYLDVASIPQLQVETAFQLSADWSPRQIDMSVRDEDALDLQAAIRLAQDQTLESVAVSIDRLSLASGFERYLKGLLEPSGWHTIHPQGELNGALLLAGQSLEQLTLVLTDVSLTDDKNRIEFNDLEGIVDYSVSGDSSDSWLNWRTASVYQVAMGEARIDFFAGGQQFQLLEPLELPIFDGSLKVSELLVTDLRSPQARVDFNATIAPISMQDITRALDWPEFTGSLSGSIPGVSISGDRMVVAGDINLNVFDGLIRISDLEIERLFGVLPSLSATIELADLDLQQVTGTFSFGEIQGRLDGHVRDLRLLDWSPVAFDLELMTPVPSRGRDLGEQRISQRAINNISSIGGGAAILSNTVMRFFDDFSYKRLGIRCRLFNHVCRMSGIEPAERGYYLIKGSGLPRINIIGYSSEVNWPQLISRLQAATRTGAVSVD